MAVCAKDNRPISLSSSERKIFQEATWEVIIVPRLVFFSPGKEIRKIFELSFLGQFAEYPKGG